MYRTARPPVASRPFARVLDAPLAGRTARATCAATFVTLLGPCPVRADSLEGGPTKALRVASGCVARGRPDAEAMRFVVTVRAVGKPDGEGVPTFEPTAFTLVEEASRERARFSLTEAFSGTSRGSCSNLDGSTAPAMGYSALRIGTDEKGRKLAVTTSEARDGGPCDAPPTRTFDIEFDGAPVECARIDSPNRDAAFFEGRSIGL